MGSCANIMALLAMGIFLGIAVGPAEGLCVYTERDWIDKGLDFVYETGGFEIEVASLGGIGIAARCYTDKEKIVFVVAIVVLGILLLSLLSCIVNCCTNPSRESRSIVVVRPKMTV